MTNLKVTIRIIPLAAIGTIHELRFIRLVKMENWRSWSSCAGGLTLHVMSEALKRVIGQRVRDARQEAGLTQEDFAARIHRTPESISKLERGVTLPDITTLLEIASATGKALTTFLDLPEERPTRSHMRQRLEARMARHLAKLTDEQFLMAIDLVQVITRRPDDNKS